MHMLYWLLAALINLSNPYFEIKFLYLPMTYIPKDLMKFRSGLLPFTSRLWIPVVMDIKKWEIRELMLIIIKDFALHQETLGYIDYSREIMSFMEKDAIHTAKEGAHLNIL